MSKPTGLTHLAAYSRHEYLTVGMEPDLGGYVEYHKDYRYKRASMAQLHVWQSDPDVLVRNAARVEAANRLHNLFDDLEREKARQRGE